MRSDNPERTNAIISRKAKARWADSEFKAKVCARMKGRKRSSKACEHVREAMLKYYATHPPVRGNYKKRPCACGCGILIKDGEKTARYVNRSHMRLTHAIKKLSAVPPDRYCKLCGRVIIHKLGGFGDYCCREHWFAEHPEHREKLSRNSKRMWREHPEWFLNQGCSYSQCMKGVLYTSKGGLVKYDSGWELAFVEIIESANIVRRFKKAPFPIWYLFEGKKHRYYPDFLLEFHDGRKFLVEIKGRTDEKTPFKHMAALRYCEEHDYEWAVIQEKPVEPLSGYLQ